MTHPHAYSPDCAYKGCPSCCDNCGDTRCGMCYPNFSTDTDAPNDKEN